LMWHENAIKKRRKTLHTQGQSLPAASIPHPLLMTPHTVTN
jgi:hypothetical protein